METYNANEKCPKCGNAQHSIKYVTDTIRKTCSTCGFVEFFLPRDSKKEEK